MRHRRYRTCADSISSGRMYGRQRRDPRSTLMAGNWYGERSTIYYSPCRRRCFVVRWQILLDPGVRTQLAIEIWLANKSGWDQSFTRSSSGRRWCGRLPLSVKSSSRGYYLFGGLSLKSRLICTRGSWSGRRNWASRPGPEDFWSGVWLSRRGGAD